MKRRLVTLNESAFHRTGGRRIDGTTPRSAAAVCVVQPRRREVENRHVLGEDLLHLGEDLPPALEIERRRLLVHQRVDPLLPLRGRRLLLMFQRCAEPELSQ